jgi:hypothetical protein
MYAPVPSGGSPVPLPPRLLRIKTFFHENRMNLLEPQGRCWNLFTPWHKDDLNSCLKGNAAFALLRCAVGDDLAPVWPERWRRERLQARRQEIGDVPLHCTSGIIQARGTPGADPDAPCAGLRRLAHAAPAQVRRRSACCALPANW